MLFNVSLKAHNGDAYSWPLPVEIKIMPTDGDE